MQVWVTREDIDNGVPEDSTQCAIAQAIWRAFPNADFVWVDGDITVVTDVGTGVDQSLTEEQLIFIEEFDAGNAVDPILIEIEESSWKSG